VRLVMGRDDNAPMQTAPFAAQAAQQAQARPALHDSPGRLV
jgi:hypothetical protein